MYHQIMHLIWSILDIYHHNRQGPLDMEDTDDWERLTDTCKSLKDKKKNDWIGQKLWKLIVQKQRDWYGKWVAEMARIAKPGVPVIIEQVSVPYCDDQVSSNDKIKWIF